MNVATKPCKEQKKNTGSEEMQGDEVMEDGGKRANKRVRES